MWGRPRRKSGSGGKITFWYDTGDTCWCLDTVQHPNLSVCVCMCLRLWVLSCFWMTPLIVNHTLLFHWNYLYVLCSSATSRQTVKNQDKRVSPLYQKNTKVFIHASVLTLSVQHIHTHTHTLLCTVKCSTKAGDVGATTRWCYNAVARPTRDVVINLCP